MGQPYIRLALAREEPFLILFRPLSQDSNLDSRLTFWAAFPAITSRPRRPSFSFKPTCAGFPFYPGRGKHIFTKLRNSMSIVVGWIELRSVKATSPQENVRIMPAITIRQISPVKGPTAQSVVALTNRTRYKIKKSNVLRPTFIRRI